MNRFVLVLLLASGLQAVRAYDLAGPLANGGDSWQTAELGYGGQYGPKNLAEEFRRNTPVLYYAFDANFYDYFGVDGANGVSGAFDVMNSLTNVDKYSKSLNEFPLQSRHVNYQAQALGLVDLKSYTLGLMMLQMGLGDPIQYSWTLRSRTGTPCPQGMSYTVIQRNFDTTSSPTNQVQYSPYVNDILYSYTITELCTPAVAFTVPFSVDPLAAAYAPIASSSPNYGDYFTGITRDDAAGLRYIYSTNNVNWEVPFAESLGLSTNTSFQEVFPVSLTASNATSVSPIQVINGTIYGTSSYADLVNFAQTNNPAALAAAYPGLQFTVLSNYFALVTVTNVVSYYTNQVGSPLNSPTLIIKKVPTQQVVEYFTYRFDNIITNLYSTTTTATNQTITIGPNIGAPLGSPAITNVSNKKVSLNLPSGEFYILPTNSACGVDIISTLVTFTNYTTNIITIATAGTNTTTTTTSTNSSANFYAQIQIIPFVGHVYVIHPVTCTQSNSVAGLYQGISNVKFVRADFDSLLGQLWQPVTNDYTMVLITNGKASTQYFRRIATTPDFLLTAADLGGGRTTENVNFDFTLNAGNGLAGPGVINPVTTITYSKTGPLYFNSFGTGMDGQPYFTETPGSGNTFFNSYFVWANFDGTTNTPVVFPNGTTIDDLQNKIFIQVSPADLPLGIVGQPYSSDAPVQFTATGGSFTPPYVWTNEDGVLNGLGLTLSPDGSLSGTPNQSGTFDFNLTLTDAVGRSAQWQYTITIQ